LVEQKADSVFFSKVQYATSGAEPLIGQAGSQTEVPRLGGGTGEGRAPTNLHWRLSADGAEPIGPQARR
jgi:hypothetical protein